MTKKEILDYATHTPYNTNKMVLSSMLDSFSKNGKVAYDTEQNLTPEEKQVARNNIDAIGREEIFDYYVITTPDTLAEAIANATPNITIVLTEGDYEIRLLGYKSYPENLTIKGSTGANVKAVEITSGLSISYNYDNADLTESIMPKGLTFTGVNFTGTFKVRNCGIEDLTITDCHFGKGAIVDISPNRADIYEHGARYEPGLVRAKNLVIRNNIFDYSADYSSSDRNSTICVASVDGTEISGNVINRTAYNGIQIASVGTAGYESCGRISISNNTINYAGSRGIRIARLKDAQLCVVGNMIKHANQIPAEATSNVKELIKITDYSYTSVVCQHNKVVGKDYTNDPNGIYINGEGIIIAKPTVPVDESHTHAVFGGVDHIIEQQHIDGYGICYRKWASGFVELWIEERLDYREDGRYLILLPDFLRPVVHSNRIIAQCDSDYLHLKDTYVEAGNGKLYIIFDIIPKIEGYKPLYVPVTAYITGFWTGTLD